MAYTTTEPGNEYLPSENIAWFSADSTDKNEDSFVYRYRLQITDTDTAFTTGTTGSDVIGTFRVPPRPVTGLGYFSPNAVAKTYVTTPLEYPTDAGTTGAGVKKFRIVYGQEYVTTSGATGMDSATGGTHYLWNSILLDEDYPSYNQDSYILQPGLTGVNFLTDGPNTRCTLTNDLLYTVVGASAGFIRDKDDLIQPTSAQNYQTPSNYTNYWQEIVGVGTTGSGWQTIGGNGIRPDYTVIGTGEYSHYVTTNTPIGPVYQGAVINVSLSTSTGWAGAATTNEMWLMGLNPGDTEPQPIVVMSESNNGGFIQYTVTDYVATQDWDYIGFVWKNVGESSAPIIRQVDTWNIDGRSAYWNVLPTGATASTQYPIAANSDQVRFAYLNVGTAGAGVTGGFSVYVTDANGNTLTETIAYSEDNCDACSNCDKVTLTWLNSLGGYDAYEFNCLSGKQLDVQRVIGDRTLTPGYTKGQRGRLNTANVATRSKVVNTNYETDAIITWLESMFMSPDVYEVQSDGTFIPVIIDTTSYSQYVTQDKLKIAEFQYSLAYNRKSQIL